MYYKWNKKENTGFDGIVNNLGRQLEKVAKCANQGSIATRKRYIESGDRFLMHIAETFKVQNISNIGNKHLESYINHLQNKGCSDKYIKTEASAIRWLHNQINNPKNELDDSVSHNKKMGIGKTADGRADRAWSDREFTDMVRIAKESKEEQIALILKICRTTGLRIDEATTLRRHHAEYAIRENKLIVTNTKGGYKRTIQLSLDAQDTLRIAMQNCKRGDYLFVPSKYKNGMIQNFEDKISAFIRKYRIMVQDSSRNRTAHNLKDSDRGALSMHGLRHMNLREDFYENLKEMNTSDALKKTAVKAGHRRGSVTLIYTNGKTNNDDNMF